MSVLSQLEPDRVFYYFEEICGIPHGSGNTGQISDYLVRFAKERGLEHYQDALGNVIIIKEATPGYEQAEAVMLQGHMDMVAVKKPGALIDMTKEGLKLAVDGDYIYAEDTSLGGDDGIAVAIGLALLDASDICHPRLEVVITVDEEVGLEGAAGIDISMCRATRMLNLDSEEEGILTVSCAGGARVHCLLPLEFVEEQGVLLEVVVDGLTGGHSGAEIHKERGNANCLLARFLQGALQKWDCRLVDVNGGLADNAIPREATAHLLAAGKDAKAVIAYADAYTKILKAEYAGKDEAVSCRIRQVEAGKPGGQCRMKTEEPEAPGDELQAEETCTAMTKESSRKAATLLFLAPNGVEAMSAQLPGMVETSLNMGQIGVENNELYLTFSVRSSIDSKKEMLMEKLVCLTESLGGHCEISGVYPGWAYREDSPLQQLMKSVYVRLYGREPVVTAIHAGLECGLFLGKKPGLDCVSYGPDMKDIHTTEERLSISSTRRIWEYTLEVLKNCN